MALSVLFDQYDLPQNDFGRQINFKIYNENTQLPYDCTFANGGAVVKTFDADGNQIVPDITVTWDTQSSGIGHFAYTQASRPNTIGDFYLCVQMWNSPLTEQISTTLRRLVITVQPSTN